MIITELYRVCRSQPCANTLPELLLSENGIIQLTVTLAARLADASYEATNGRWHEARHRYGFKIKKLKNRRAFSGQETKEGSGGDSYA